MAKAVINTAQADQPVHTRTTAGTEESQAVVLGIDGSDAVVPADATFGIGADVKRLPALAAGTNNIGDVDVLTLPALVAGTANIGDVDVLTLPALPAGTNNIGDVDVLTQPARSRTVDAVAAALQTDALMNGLVALTPKFAIIDAATLGDNTVVAAVAGKKIRVCSLFVVAAAAVVVRFESGAAGTALTGQMNLAANGGFVLPFNPFGWFETAAATLLNLELGGAVSVDGGLQYVEV